MRKRLNIYAIILLFAFIVSACKKDSKTDTPLEKNHFSVDGADYDISQGFLSNMGMEGSAYRIDLNLLSSGLTIHEHLGLPDSLSGTGNIVSFELFCSGTGKPSTGDYIFKITHQAGSFDQAHYIFDWNTATNPNPTYINFILGTVKIIQNDPEYELSFSGTDGHNSPVTGYYKGSLKYYTYPGDKK
jgi:hypothetical protein